MEQEWQVDDISALINYFDSQRKNGASPEVGQIVRAPALYTDRKPMIADASRSNPHTHTQADIKVRTVDDAIDFRGKPGRLPIYSQYLSQTEELVLSRAKKRPCVILAKTEGVDHTKLPSGAQQNKALYAFDTVYWLAPIYSISTAKKSTSFGPVMTARVKCMMYPEFMYVPQARPALDNPGVIRLDRMFWSFLLGASDPQNLFLSPETMGICWNQIRMLAGEAPNSEHVEMRDLLMSYLPPECL